MMTKAERKQEDQDNIKAQELQDEQDICMVCGIEVIFNLHIYKLTGMCGTCSIGEARLNYEED